MRVRDIASMFSPAIGCAAPPTFARDHHTLTLAYGSPVGLIAVGCGLTLTISLIACFIYSLTRRNVAFRNNMRRNSNEPVKPHAYGGAHLRQGTTTRARAESKP